MTSHTNNTRNPSFSNILIFGILVAAALIPSFILSKVQYVNEYITIPLVRVVESGDDGSLSHMNFSGFNFIPEHHGVEIISLILSRLSALPIQSLMFIPIGGILLPVVYFSLCRLCYLDRLSAALATLSIVYDPTISLSSYNILVYTFSRILILAFIIILLRLIRNKTPSFGILLLMVFIGLYTLYWTDPLLMISFAGIINILMLIGYLTSRKATFKRNSSIYWVLAFFIIYFGLGTFLYSLAPRILDAGGFTQIQVSIMSFRTRVEQVLGISTIDNQDSGGFASPSITSYLQIVRYTLILVPVALILFLEIRKAYSEKKFDFSIGSMVLFAMAGTLIVHIVVYSSYGHTSTRNIAFWGPLMLAIALDKLRLKIVYSRLVLCVLALLSIPGFFAVVQKISSEVNFDSIEQASAWILERKYDQESDEVLIYGDLGVYGMLAMDMAEAGVVPNYHTLSKDTVAWLLYTSTADPEDMIASGYLAVDSRSIDALFTPGWGYQDPLSVHLDQIKNNDQLHLLYDNGDLRIYVPNTAQGER